MVNEHNVSLSDHVRAIILGSLLGDGSLKIHTPYKNARFSFRHSAVQKEYFQWKVLQLEQIASPNGSVFVQKPDGFSIHEKLRFQSRALSSLTELHTLTHQHGKFIIRRRWLNQMTPLSLAIWWCDDGSIVANGRKGVFCTDGFDKDSLKILARYLHVVWKIRVHIGKVGRKRFGKQNEYYHLWIFSTEEFKKFLRLILPYVAVPSMLSKVILLYNDLELQQRWISEVSTLSGFSRETVEQAVREKKSKWKRYRE